MVKDETTAAVVWAWTHSFPVSVSQPCYEKAKAWVLDNITWVLGFGVCLGIVQVNRHAWKGLWCEIPTTGWLITHGAESPFCKLQVVNFQFQVLHNLQCSLYQSLEQNQDICEGGWGGVRGVGDAILLVNKMSKSRPLHSHEQSVHYSVIYISFDLNQGLAVWSRPMQSKF